MGSKGPINDNSPQIETKGKHQPEFEEWAIPPGWRRDVPIRCLSEQLFLLFCRRAVAVLLRTVLVVLRSIVDHSERAVSFLRHFSLCIDASPKPTARITASTPMPHPRQRSLLLFPGRLVPPRRCVVRIRPQPTQRVRGNRAPWGFPQAALAPKCFSRVYPRNTRCVRPRFPLDVCTHNGGGYNVLFPNGHPTQLGHWAGARGCLSIQFNSIQHDQNLAASLPLPRRGWTTRVYFFPLHQVCFVLCVAVFLIQTKLMPAFSFFSFEL